jgi:glycosyltransferase involved in cell wall biosynthesis
VKLIFINRFFHPDHSATSQMLSDLAFALAREGHEVGVITSRQLYDTPSAKLAHREFVDGVAVTRVWASRFGRSILLGRAFDYLTFYLTSAWALWRTTRHGDVVIAKTDPPMLSLIARPITRIRGAYLINWLQDIFPEVARALGVGNNSLGRLIFPLVQKLRDRSLKAARRNVVLGHRMAQRVSALGVADGQIEIIANWADGTLIEPLECEANPLREEWVKPQRFVVAYSGNLGRAHDIATILDAIAVTENVAKEVSNGPSSNDTSGSAVLWLFIGGGAQYQSLATEAKLRGLKSIAFKPYQPRERLAESLSCADVHLISLRPELEGLIVPSKFYGIAAAGRPTIFVGSSDGEIAGLLKLHDCGITIEQGDGAALARAILNLEANPLRCREMGANARRIFEAEFDKTIAIARWQSLLKALELDPSKPSEEQLQYP